MARNAIVRRARTALVLMLDDDTVVRDEKAIADAIDVLSNRASIGAVGFAQAESDGSPWPASAQPSVADYPCLVPAFIGFAHLLRRDAFLEVGGYREAFYFYGEEKDFCLRLLDAGWEVAYLPHARVVHLPDPAGRSAVPLSSPGHSQRLPGCALQRTFSITPRHGAGAPVPLLQDAKPRPYR